MAIGSIDNCRHCRTHSPIKKAAKTVVTAGVAAGSVLYLAKKGKLNPTEGGNKFTETIKKGLKTVADPILDKLGAVKAKLVEKAGKTGIMDKIPAKDSIANGAKTAKNGVVSAFGKIKETAGNVFERIAHPGKFNPDVATAADKAAETFNNFVK